jgi:hypothetical protein
MGAGQSIPSTLTREKAFELTRDTRAMMDVLLDYMLKEITVRDFLALSNPTECKKYVVFLANTIYKHFYELQIVPTKDKQGVIAFRPVKALVNPPEEDESMRQSLCLTLAYFYTRIFQIYGALALTVLDDAKFMTDAGLVGQYGDTFKKGLIAPGYRPYLVTGGGAPPSQKLGEFAFLRSFLADEDYYPPNKFGYVTVYNEISYSKDDVRFIPSTKESTGQRGIFNIAIKGTPISQYDKLYLFSAPGRTVGEDRTVTWGKLIYYKKDGVADTIDLDSSILIQRKLTIEEKPGSTKYKSREYSIKGQPETISEYFSKVIGNVIGFIRRAREGDTAGTSLTSGVIISETGTAEELRLAKIVQNLTRTKPLGHCIARAMQLLKIYPLDGEKKAVSSICKAKFAEQTTVSSSGIKTTVSRSGIPEPGAALDTSPGLSALSQLFYDTVLIGSPKIIMGQKPYGPEKKSTEQQYFDFMKKMGTLFGDNVLAGDPTPNTTKVILKTGLSGIKNKRDQQFCKDMPEQITVPPKVIGNVYDVVNKLFQVQVRHAAECGKIIKQLFNIQRDKSSGLFRISLSDGIIKKGFPEIERINYESRQLLANYYYNCEMNYLQGMKIVLDNSPEAIALREKTKAKTKPPVAPTASAPPSIPSALPKK